MLEEARVCALRVRDALLVVQEEWVSRELQGRDHWTSRLRAAEGEVLGGRRLERGVAEVLLL